MGDWTGTVPTFAAGAKLRGADEQTLADIDTALVTAWSTWSPTLTNLTLGNGTQTARYRRLGKTIDYYFRFVLGSTSAVGTDPTFTLPAACAGHYPTGGDAFFPTSARLVDLGVSTKQGDLTLTSTTVVRFVSWNATPALAQVTATAPHTWGTGDWLGAWGSYETA